MNSMILTSEGAIVYINGRPYIVGLEHPNFKTIQDKARNNEWDEIPGLADIVKTINVTIQRTGNKDLVIKGDQIEYKHIVFPSDLSAYVINMIRDNFDLKPMVNFMDKLLANPDHRVFQQLFGFLSYGKTPITPDGNILAYKKVRADYTSCHDGVTDHSVGNVVTLPREKCNSDPEQTCSTGLHFCSKDYLQSFNGSRVVVVEISPTDVVSIPVDYNNTKGRACKYTVVGELDDLEITQLNTSDVLRVASVETRFVAEKAKADKKAKKAKTKPEKAVKAEQTATQKPVALDATQYTAGYADGRKKLAAASQDVSYAQGYKDGRGRKKRQVSADAALTDEQQYIQGYADGKSKLAADGANGNAMYIQGYKDGRGRKKKLYR